MNGGFDILVAVAVWGIAGVAWWLGYEHGRHIERSQQQQ